MTSLAKHKSQWVIILDHVKGKSNLSSGVLVKKFRTKKEALLYCQTNELDVNELDKNGVCRKVHLFNADALQNVK